MLTGQNISLLTLWNKEIKNGNHHQSHDSVVMWSLHSWAPDQFPLHVWAENQWCIYSCITCLEQVDLAEPIAPQVKPQLMSSNLKGHRHTAIDSIVRIIHPDCKLQSRKPPTIPAVSCHVITAQQWTPVYSTVLNGHRPAIRGICSLMGFLSNPVQDLVILTRKTWWRNQFSHWWIIQMAGITWPCSCIKWRLVSYF